MVNGAKTGHCQNWQIPLGHMELVTTASCGISHTSFCKGGNNHNFFGQYGIRHIFVIISINTFVGVEKVTTKKS